MPDKTFLETTGYALNKTKIIEVRSYSLCDYELLKYMYLYNEQMQNYD